jgi:glycosyltransferase involved in cell wall biosynthesis
VPQFEEIVFSLPHAQPLVTILIPAFDAAAFIADSVECALRQTWSRVEIVVAPDDGYDYRELRERFPSPRLRIIEPGAERESGPGPTRNRAIDAARGEFFTVLDADDLIAPTHTERMMRVAIDEGAAIAPTRYSEWNPLRTIRIPPLSEKPLTLRGYGRLLASMHPLQHRSLEVGYSSGFAEDVIHDGLVIGRCGSVPVVDSTYYILRRRIGSLCNRGPDAERAIQRSYDRRIEQIERRPTELGLQVLDAAQRRDFAQLFRFRRFVSLRFSESGADDYNRWTAGKESDLWDRFTSETAALSADVACDSTPQ